MSRPPLRLRSRPVPGKRNLPSATARLLWLQTGSRRDCRRGPESTEGRRPEERFKCRHRSLHFHFVDRSALGIDHDRPHLAGSHRWWRFNLPLDRGPADHRSQVVQRSARRRVLAERIATADQKCRPDDRLRSADGERLRRVGRRSLVELRAVYMPDVARSVSGHPPN